MNYEEIRIQSINLAISAGLRDPAEIVAAAIVFEQFICARGDFPTPSQCKEKFDNALSEMKMNA